MLVPHRAMKRLIATAAMAAGVAVVWLNLPRPPSSRRPRT